MMLSRKDRNGRRHVGATVAILVGVALVAAGCSSTTSDESTADTPADASSGAFPVTIDTAYGEITVDEKPERIVTFHGQYVEFLSLVDEEPLAFASGSWDNEQFLASFPWLEGTYQGEPDPSLVSADGQTSAEAIAALEPDLILTTIWMTTEETYQQLSAIAPTYVGIETGVNTSWQDHLASVATLTGHDPAIADETQAQLNYSYAAAAERLPGLQGKTFEIPTLGRDNTFSASMYGNELIFGLGLIAGEGQPEDASAVADVQPISRENVDQLTSDVLFFATRHIDPSGDYETVLEADPRIAELPATQNGTLIYLSAPEFLALNGGTPSSHRWWLDRIVPQLEESALNQGTQ